MIAACRWTHSHSQLDWLSVRVGSHLALFLIHPMISCDDTVMMTAPYHICLLYTSDAADE